MDTIWLTLTNCQCIIATLSIFCLLYTVCQDIYEPMKTKYATEVAEAFKKKIKNKQPEKVWVDDGKEFFGAFQQLCSKRGIHLYSTFSEKSLLLLRGISDHLKNSSSLP